MGQIVYGTSAAILVGLFGLFLIWQGITGNVPLGIDRKPLIPKFLYIISGIIMLILPVAFFVVRLMF
jgi:hypothetical protein